MTRADFYLIDKPRFRDDPLLLVCELVKKAYAAAQPTLILARSPEQADALDDKLWAFDDDSFIPHQLAGDEDDAMTAVVIAAPGVAKPPIGRWSSIFATNARPARTSACSKSSPPIPPSATVRACAGANTSGAGSMWRSTTCSVERSGFGTRDSRCNQPRRRPV